MDKKQYSVVTIFADSTYNAAYFDNELEAITAAQTLARWYPSTTIEVYNRQATANHLPILIIQPTKQ